MYLLSVLADTHPVLTGVVLASVIVAALLACLWLVGCVCDACAALRSRRRISTLPRRVPGRTPVLSYNDFDIPVWAVEDIVPGADPLTPYEGLLWASAVSNFTTDDLAVIDQTIREAQS
jgi:hypothetical protein